MKTDDKLRFAAWASRWIQAARKICGRGNQAVVKRGGLYWELDLQEGIDLAIFLFGRFERGTARSLARFAGSGSVVFDIGANIGALTLPLARMVGVEGKVHAFEPTDYAFDKLRRNLHLNPAIESRVTAIQAKLGRSNGLNSPGEIYSSWKVGGDEPRHPKHFGIAKSAAGAINLSLDDYCRTNNISCADVIKLDVDGFESEVIAGGIDTLRRNRPVICMELAPYVLEERGSSLEELLSLLSSCGYRLTKLTGEPLMTDAVELRDKIPDGSGVNVLAIPREPHTNKMNLSSTRHFRGR
jgi:FkbM family methyltransferase